MCCLQRTVDRGFGEFIKQGMGLAVEHTIALLDGDLADGLCQMAFAAAMGGPDKKRKSSVTGDEGRGRQIEDQTRDSSWGLKVIVEVVQGFFADRETELACADVPANGRHDG